MFKSKIIGLSVLFVLVVSAGILLASSSDPEKKGAAFLANNQEEKSNLDYIEFVASQTTTPFALLEQSGFDIDFKQYDVGVFVESIGELANGQNNKYWLYYVNGESPMSAADQMEIGPGDRVEWRFEQSIF